MIVTLDNIPVGKWRYLTDAEMAAIERMVAASSKTMEASVLSKSEDDME